MTTSPELETDSVARNYENRRQWNSELIQRYNQIKPGSTAEEDLVREYIPVVKSIVARLAISLPSHIGREDLYSSGLVGLLNAIRNFDPAGGSLFDSYARVRIRGAIFDELRSLDWVPRSVHDRAKKVQNVIQQIEQEKGDVASSAEVAAAMGLSESEYEELLEGIKGTTFISLDCALGDDDGSVGHEFVADDAGSRPSDRVERQELALLIAERIKALPEMQRKVLAMYYFEGMWLREIAAVFKVTESRICQIHTQAILGIKAHLRRHKGLLN
jgi:RNA polymerase sigma factor for flagellar operon FliA